MYIYRVTNLKQFCFMCFTICLSIVLFMAGCMYIAGMVCERLMWLMNMWMKYKQHKKIFCCCCWDDVKPWLVTLMLQFLVARWVCVYMWGPYVLFFLSFSLFCILRMWQLFLIVKLKKRICVQRRDTSSILNMIKW